MRETTFSTRHGQLNAQPPCVRRASQSTSFVLLGLLLLISAPVGRTQSPGRTSTEPVPWLKALRTTHSRRSSAVPHGLSPGKDDWISEQYDEEIEARLKEFSAVLAAEPIGPDKVANFIHPTFHGTSLTPSRRIIVRKEVPMVERIEPGTVANVTAAEFPAELQRFLIDLGTLQRVN